MMKLCITIFVVFVLAFVQAGTDEEEVNRGKKMKVAGLTMKANNTLGSGMFEMGKDGDQDNKISFGVAKIAELAADDTVLTDAKHGCNFDADDAGIECTEDDETEGTMSGLDEEANATDIKYSLIKRECVLSSCNTNQNAKIVISTYIMKESGYLCQPDCEADSFEQSVVFNGTAKWTIEIKDWDFCTGCGDSSDKVAAKMKIFFSLTGKSEGRPSAPAKRDRVPFDVTKCEKRIDEERDELERELTDELEEEDDDHIEEDDDHIEELDDDEEELDDDEEELDDDEEEVDHHKKEVDDKEVLKDADKKKLVSDTDNSDINANDKYDQHLINKEIRCKAAIDTSFDDQPEDQESFNFSDEEGESGSMVFRMFPSAILDKDHDDEKIVNTDSGFVGPAVEVVKEPVGNKGKTRDVKYVTICVDKFSKSVLYDPTGDMSESGGTTTPTSTATLIRATLAVVLASLAVLLY